MAISVPVIWGMGFTLAKVAFVHADFPPILLMAFRFSLTALLMVWFVKPPWGQMWPIFWIAVVSATIQYSLTFTGMTGIDASTAIIIVQLEFPFMAIMAAIFLKDRMSTGQVMGVIVAIFGIILIAGQPDLKGGLSYIIMLISGAFAWAVGQIMIKKLKTPVGGFSLIAWVALFAAPQLFLMSWIIEDGQMEVIRTTSWIGWGVVVYLALLMTVVGYSIWYHILGKYPVSQIGPFLLLLPVSSIAGSMVLLGETLSNREMIGAVIVIFGVWTVTKPRAPKTD
ncbi:MAG: O-acetylserine/cysteine efflux transporter [Paracoccaceae bacterium]|jgi:O-acetylserine/cysteine efflux transporter